MDTATIFTVRVRRKAHFVCAFLFLQSHRLLHCDFTKWIQLHLHVICLYPVCSRVYSYSHRMINNYDVSQLVSPTPFHSDKYFH